jgi:hypothetical protein
MRVKLAGLTVVAILITGLAGIANTSGSEAAGTGRVVTGFGIVPGQDLFVHVAVEVGPGQSDHAAVNAALAAQGARPLTSEEFSLTGLVHDGASDGAYDGPQDDVIIVYYPNNSEGIDVPSLVTSSIGPWNGEQPDSALNLVNGGNNGGVCPSLLRECPGRQVLNGSNELAFYPLKSNTTLAVTWSSASADEFDIAFNTNFDWTQDGTAHAGKFDVTTVGIHEVGHGAGVGHSDVGGAVMEPVYAGVRLALHEDDINALLALYGGDGGTVEPTPPAPAVEVESLEISGADAGPYSNRETVRFSVHATAVSGGAAAGATIDVRILTASGRTLAGSATADGSGNASFSYKVNSKRDGTGIYTISATSGAAPVAEAPFLVQ